MKNEKKSLGTSKKFTRKKKAEPVEPTSLKTWNSTNEDYGAFVSEAKKLKSELLVCGSPEDTLIKVNDWIMMPKQIQDLIGVPGLPCGLITMCYGEPDCGKSTFCNEALASTQRDGGFAVLFLTELKYDSRRAQVMGVKIDGKPGSLIKYRPVTIEQVGDYIAEVAMLIDKSKTKKKVCIVWDSLGATCCENELKKDRTDFSMDAAKAITGVLRKTQALIRDKNIAFVMINQVYDKSGVFFGKKTTTRGGKSPRYFSALCLEFAKLGRIRPAGKKAGEDFAGIKTLITVEKNHLGQPFRTGEVHIDWKGFVFERDSEYAPEGYYTAEPISDGEEIGATVEVQP